VISHMHDRNIFRSAHPNVQGNENLRTPQREGFAAIKRHFSARAGEPDEVGIILPVGVGKSALIALTPFATGAERVLIVAPGLQIAKQLKQLFDPASQNNIYTALHILDDPSGVEVSDISGSNTNLSDLREANVVVANIQQLQRKDNPWLATLPNNFFDLLINDEAHHNVAVSWDNLRRKFSKANVVNFSATPDRADGQRMAGEIIYTFTIFRATQEHYIKRLSAVVLNPRTLRYVRRSAGREVVVDLEEVKRLGQVDADFRRSIVSSAESLATIVDASIRELEQLRQSTNNYRHKIIASALNIEHCIQITEAYRARGVRCEYIHSKRDSKINEKILRQLHDDSLDAIVQVRMLGEGFDHPYLSVAAVLSIFANLSPFVQFVGRIMRTVHEQPWDANNVGTVVFHAGANVASLWTDFQDYSEADQDFFDQLLPVRDIFVEEEQAEIRLTPRPRPEYEAPIYITAQEDIGLDAIPLLANDPDAQEAIALLASKGITVDEFREALTMLKPVPVTKQRRRRAARVALDSRIKTVAAQILASHELNAEGHELDRQHRGRSNFVVVKALLDRECNKLVDRPAGSRNQMSQAELDDIVARLDQIRKDVERRLFSG
jgi:superfamily II DNA or RNA helicase